MIDPAVYDLGIPIFGICYGAQLIAQQLGGEVARNGRGEYGRTELRRDRRVDPALFVDGCRRTARLDEPLRLDRRAAARVRRHGAHRRRRRPCSRTPARRIYGVQFHPEVAHTPAGRRCSDASVDVCGCRGDWTMGSVIDDQVAAVRAQVGAGRAICGLSRRRRLRRRRGAGAPGDRPPAYVRLRRHRADAQGRERAGRRDVPAQHGHRADPRRRRRAVLRTARRGHRAGGQAQGDRRAVRPDLRGEHRWRHRRRVPRPGHALSGRDREWRQGRHRRGDQEPSQRRRVAGGHDVGARRAAARPVQGRGPQGRHANSACPTRSSGASRSPDRGSGCGSSAR